MRIKLFRICARVNREFAQVALEMETREGDAGNSRPQTVERAKVAQRNFKSEISNLKLRNLLHRSGSSNSLCPRLSQNISGNLLRTKTISRSFKSAAFVARACSTQSSRNYLHSSRESLRCAA